MDAPVRHDPLDHEHLVRAVAYAMMRRHVEPGEVIASGVLASPWTAVSGVANGPHRGGLEDRRRAHRGLMHAVR